MIPSPATAVSFNFTTFTQNTIADIFFQGDSFASNGVLQLTKNAVGESLRSSAGRVTSRQLIPLWDRSTGELTDFTTHFTFRMKAANLSENYGDGMTFFLSPANSQIPANSTGGYLALFSPDTALNGDKGHRIVAVEFDSSRNSWDPSDDHNELLLVYEFLPNGSLDQHLFGGGERSRTTVVLDWPVRYKIAQGLASGLLYLHEEWEQCVVHRDIKSSNVMLDSNFNAKLGDFGLARLVDHELGSQTTVLAGTMGYLAPECVTTGKASKESDVYSFGVVCLEIACGRKPVDPKQELRKVRLVEWVWDLYGQGEILEAVDWKLGGGLDSEEVERLMIVGLWCCHPDEMNRPSIRQVISVLKMEAPLPSLPAKLPVPMYYAPPVDITKFKSYDTTSSGAGRTQTTTRTSSSAGSAWSGDGLLVSQKR
ncbi:L-type lectin-domain containing receptor kinase IX.1 [Linum grandiflorum]